MNAVPARRGPIVHVIKCSSEFFPAIWDASKLFEVRKDDRDYQAGDVAVIRELSPTGFYTARSGIFRVGYVLRDFAGLRRGYCAFSLLDPDDEALALAECAF